MPPWAGRMGEWRQPMDRHEKSPSAQSHPLKRSSQPHFRVDLIRVSVARGGKYSPASRLCQYRVLRPVLSAICSCVIPAPTRIADTFRPKRVRSRQGTGFFDGMPRIVSKTKQPQHEALPRVFELLNIHWILKNMMVTRTPHPSSGIFLGATFPDMISRAAEKISAANYAVSAPIAHSCRSQARTRKILK